MLYLAAFRIINSSSKLPVCETMNTVRRLNMNIFIEQTLHAMANKKKNGVPA